jgi:RHS repeat-associated protein
VLAVYEAGSVAFWKILDPYGTVIGRRDGSSRLYYHRDHLGSTRAVVDGTGTVVQAYDFMPFGMEMDRSLIGGSPTRNKFTGHETDEETGLIHMEWRRYLAEFGRFLSVDPLADEYPGWSPYAYALNNPLIFIDPDGLLPCVSRDLSGNCTSWSGTPGGTQPEEIARFRQAEISAGLQHMLNLMNEHNVEIASFMVQSGEGNVELVVFDFSKNTADESHNPAVGTTAAGKKVYKGSEVIAQIHTHSTNPRLLWPGVL